MRYRWLFSIGLLLLATLTVAAPMLPQKPAPLPDEVLSTAQVTRVRLEVVPLPRAVTAAGLSAAKFREIVTPVFKAAEISVVEDPAEALVKIQVLLIGDAKATDALTALVFLEFHQSVRIPRLKDRALFVPTVTLLNPAPATRESLRTVMETLLTGLAGQFTASVGGANAALPAE